MAGLLDIFGTSGAESLGLLGMTPADIQSARDDAQAQALYGLAGRLFQGGNTGASIAEGLQQGQKLYRSAMKDQLQEQLTMTQLQEAQRKKKEEALAKALFMRGYQPAQAAVEAVPGQFYGQETALPLRDDEGNLMPGATLPVEGRAAQAASFNLGSIAPQLIALGETGQAKLKTALDLQKAMAGETFKLGEGEKQYQRDPLTGEIKEVAAGTAKEKAIQFQDLGNVVIGIQGGKEVMRLPKGRAPEGPIALQHVETDQGLATFNPRTGQLTPIVQGGKPVMGKGAGNLNESQGSAVNYGMRMSAADSVLKPLENAGLKDTGKIRSGVSGTLGAVPLIGDALSRGSDNVFNTLPTILGGLSEEQQQVIQARTNFITAVLRKESGASISPGEYATAEKNYFPAPGDSEKIVKQKQQARDLAIKGMKIQAGPGGKFINQSQDTPTSSGW